MSDVPTIVDKKYNPMELDKDLYFVEKDSPS